MMKYMATLFFFAAALLAGAARAGDAPVREAAPDANLQRDIDPLLRSVSNWGRWGEDDELGTLNLIIPEVTAAAARLIEDGTRVSLSRQLDETRSDFNPNPLEHDVGKGPHGGATFAGDKYAIEYHGWAHSHLDALSHMSISGSMYNDFPWGDVVAGRSEEDGEIGAQRLGIENMSSGIQSRGVLIDMARFKGVPYLEPGTAITRDDILSWEKESGVLLSQGDVLLIRTGRWKRWQELGPWDLSAHAAGLHYSAMTLLHERGIAALGSDGVNDVNPSGVAGYRHPVHLLALVAMGMPLLDNLDLEALAAKASERGRNTFFITIAPLNIRGGTGSPVNPIATF